MAYWLDAQLPPQLAPWLTTTFAVPAFSVAYLGYRDASDDVIFEAARQACAVLVTKDSDFLDRIKRSGPPPQLLWITCGNVSTAALKLLLTRLFPEAHQLFSAGEPVVEIAG